MSPLAAKVMKRFSTIPPYPRENYFLGPYNKLLHTFFPADSDYTVIPQSYSFLDSYGSANTIIEFEVVFEDNPVFFLQIKESQSLAVLSARGNADDQMRKRMRDLAPNCPLDTLHGVSAFGTRLRSTATINKPVFFPGAYLLTVSERPISRRRVAGTATFWKMKRVNDSKILLQRSRQNATSFEREGDPV